MSDDAEMRLTTVLEADISNLTSNMDKARAQTSNALDDMGGAVERGQKRIQAAVDKIKANNAIKIAVASGDDGAIQALQEQLALQKEIARFQRAGLSKGDAESQARAHIGAVQQAQAQAAAAQRSAAMQQLQLEERLQVAQASGNRREIEQLQEQMSLAQRIARYRQAGMDQHTATHMAESQLASLAAARAGSTPGLNRAQTMEMTHVAKSLFDQVAAGASPMRAIEVEGGRIAQIFSEGEGGVGGTFKALTGLVTPMNLALGGAAAVALLVAASFGRVKAAAQEIGELKISSD
ncbi:MAG: phage tail length tape measure family protein, partial [Caulobacteraceae bacterium]